MVFNSCELEPLQVLLHPDVETRVKESLNYIHLEPPLLGDTFKFAVFSDIHIGNKSGCYLTEFTRSAESLEIDFFCVTGDLTHHGSKEEYDSLASALQSMAVFYGLFNYVTLGNHDLYSDGSWENFKEHFGPSCASRTPHPRLKLIFLDTGEGRLGATQFQWLEKELSDTMPILKIVLTHFPLYDDKTPSIFRLASTAERTKLQSLLQKYKVYAICSGHIHGFRHTEINGVHHFIVGTMSKDLDFGKPGYLLFEFQSDSISYRFISF
ncbi:MAG: metallophosphoesterase [candidate division WOR-3 bacterium]